MEFPVDVLTQIRAFAKPLPRRAISNFWVHPTGPNNYDELHEMITGVHIDFAEYITKRENDNDPDIYLSSEKDDINAPDLGIWTGLHTLRYELYKRGRRYCYQVTFTMEDVMIWNGKFDGLYELSLEKDEDCRYQVYTKVNSRKTWKTLPEEPELSYHWHHDYNRG